MGIPSLDDISGFAAYIFDAVRSGNWKLVASLAVIGLVSGLRKWGPAALKGDRGGAATALLLGVAGAFATAFAAGASFSLKLAVDGLSVGLAAIGGFVGIKKLLKPSDAQK